MVGPMNAASMCHIGSQLRSRVAVTCPGPNLLEANPIVMDLLGIENADTFANLSNVLDFYHLDKKVIIAVPECYDFTPNKNWEMNVIDIATRALNEHLNRRRRMALERGVIMRSQAKRSPTI